MTGSRVTALQRSLKRLLIANRIRSERGRLESVEAVGRSRSCCALAGVNTKVVRRIRLQVAEIDLVAQALRFGILGNLIQVAGVFAIKNSAGERLVGAPCDHCELIIRILNRRTLRNIYPRGCLLCAAIVVGTFLTALRKRSEIHNQTQ
jgi:hypothetical protein